MLIEIDPDTLEKIRYYHGLIEHHGKLQEELRIEARRLIYEKTGIRLGVIDLDKGVVNGPDGHGPTGTGEVS